MTNCSAHPSAIAGWSCIACHRTLCPDCTGWRAAGYGRIELCMHCGAVARRLRTHRSDLAPFSGTIWGALVWPISLSGIIALLTMALIVHSLSLFGGAASILGDAIASAYLFQILRHTAAGRDNAPGPSDFDSLMEGIIEPWFRALICSLWFVIPLFLWMDAKGLSPLNILMHEEPVPAAPAAFLLLFCGSLLYPMAIIAGSLGAPITTLFNPIRIVRLSIRVGSDYLLCAVFCFACTIGAGMLATAAENNFAKHPFLLDGFTVALIALYLPFVAFRALGLLVRARGDAVGYGGKDSYRVPTLDAQAKHEVKPPVAEPERDRSFTPINLAAASGLAPTIERMELTGQERNLDRAERNERAKADRESLASKSSVPASDSKEQNSWKPRRPSSIGPRFDAPAVNREIPGASSPNEKSPASDESPVRSALDLVGTRGATVSSNALVAMPAEQSGEAAPGTPPTSPTSTSTNANTSTSTEAQPEPPRAAESAAALDQTVISTVPAASPEPEPVTPAIEMQQTVIAAVPVPAPEATVESTAIALDQTVISAAPVPAAETAAVAPAAMSLDQTVITGAPLPAVDVTPVAPVAEAPPATPAIEMQQTVITAATAAPASEAAPDATPAAPAELAASSPHSMRLAKCMELHDLEGARAVLREAGAGIPANTLPAQSWNELAKALAEDATRAQAEEKRAFMQDTAGANSEEKVLLAKAAGRARAEEKRALAELALFACRRSVEVAPESNLAPRTWLLAARLCDELLQDRMRSNRLLGELLRRFPATEEGRFASKRLGST